MRLTRDEIGLQLASVWALRGTCVRRQVGCVLFNAYGYELGSGYNGPAAGEPHCRNFGGMTDRPCQGAIAASGTDLDKCESLHAEANSLLRCTDVTAIHVAYVTHSPCLHCVKLLMNTGCERIVFLEPYAHDAPARALWEGSTVVKNGALMRGIRTWEHHYNWRTL